MNPVNDGNPPEMAGENVVFPADNESAGAQPASEAPADPLFAAGLSPDIDLQAGAAAGLTGELARLQAALEAAQAEAAKNHELFLRAVAETENIRRRSADEVSKAHKFAIESFAEALIPARDSLEMALSIPNQTLESLREGVEATLRQLTTGFEKGRLQEINPVGEKFDPHRHQAVSMVPGNSVEPPVASNHVVAVLQKGYLIADRVLRPALVAVAQ